MAGEVLFVAIALVIFIFWLTSLILTTQLEDAYTTIWPFAYYVAFIILSFLIMVLHSPASYPRFWILDSAEEIFTLLSVAFVLITWALAFSGANSLFERKQIKREKERSQALWSEARELLREISLEYEKAMKTLADSQGIIKGHQKRCETPKGLQKVINNLEDVINTMEMRSAFQNSHYEC